MSWVSDVVNSVSGDAGDAVAAVGDAMDGATEALENGGAWLEGEAGDVWSGLAGGSIESMDQALASIADTVTGALDGVTAGLTEIGDELGNMPALLVERAIAQLGELPDRLFDGIELGIEDALSGAFAALAEVERSIEDLCGRLAAEVEDALADLWDRVLSGIESAVEWIESLASVHEKLALWLGRALVCVAEALAILGSCLGGIVAYHLVKDATVAANFYGNVRLFPQEFRDFCSNVYPEFYGPQNGWLGWSNTWFIDNANLPLNLFGSTVLGMTLEGVTFQGVHLSHLVFLVSDFRLNEYWRVSNAMHELVHVRQMIRLVLEDVFACAYGAGCAIAGYNMRKHPMEVEARRLECSYQKLIQQWTGDPNMEYAINPCDLTTEAVQPCVGLP